MTLRYIGCIFPAKSCKAAMARREITPNTIKPSMNKIHPRSNIKNLRMKKLHPEEQEKLDANACAKANFKISFYSANRRPNPIKANKPVPSRTNEPGSGTAPITVPDGFGGSR